MKLAKYIGMTVTSGFALLSLAACAAETEPGAAVENASSEVTEADLTAKPKGLCCKDRGHCVGLDGNRNDECFNSYTSMAACRGARNEDSSPSCKWNRVLTGAYKPRIRAPLGCGMDIPC